MSQLRRSIALMRVPDELEWHRWLLGIRVVVARDSGLAYWAWLEFVERKTGWSRSTGEWIRRYRSVSRRARRASHERRTYRLNRKLK